MIDDFLEPGRLWLLLVVVGLGLASLAASRWRRSATVRFTQLDVLDRVAPSRPGWRRHVVTTVQLLGLAAAVIAVARPVERTTERTRSEGRILVLFDVSLSMQADDVDPDRFSAAQDAARQFVDEVEQDVEVGLVSFSGTVSLEVDPTLDRGEVERGIERLELAESTAIGDALALGSRLLVDLADAEGGDGDGEATAEDEPADDVAPPEQAPGVMVLLSDGETTVGRPTIVGAQDASAAGIPVYTIAFGTETGTIADPLTGDIVPVPVRPAELQAVADETGGQAFEAQTGSELADAYDQIREALGDTLGEEVEVVEELTWRWAMASFALVAIGSALGLWWLRGMI